MTRTDIDCGHCERPEDRCSDESERNCYRPEGLAPLADAQAAQEYLDAHPLPPQCPECGLTEGHLFPVLCKAAKGALA